MRHASFSAQLPPKKPPPRGTPPREYLTADEVEYLFRAARRQGRYRHRNATMILLMYRHACGSQNSCACAGIWWT